MQGKLQGSADAGTSALAFAFEFALPAGSSVPIDVRSGISLHLHRSSWEAEEASWEYVFTARRDGFEPALIGCRASVVDIGAGLSRQDLRADEPATVRSLASLGDYFGLDLPEYAVYLGFARALLLPFSARVDIRHHVCYRVLASTVWLCAHGPDPRAMYPASAGEQVVVAELPLA